MTTALRFLAGLVLASLLVAPVRAQPWNGPADAGSVTFAGNRFGFPTQIYTFPSTPTHLSQYWTASPPYAVSNLRLLYANFYVAADGSANPERCPGNAQTVDFASVIVGGVFHPVTFGGATTVRIGDCEFVWSDPLRDSSGALVTIPANAGYHVRSSITPVPAGGNIVAAPAPMLSLSRVGAAGGYGDGLERTASPQTAKRLAGTVNTLNLGSSTVGPAMAVGTGWDGSPVFLVLGDSIGAGQADNDLASSPRAAAGYLARALDDAAGSTRYNFVNLASHGTRPGDQASIATGQYRLRMRVLRSLPNRPFNRVLSEMGQNGITGDLARWKAEMVDWWRFWHGACPTCPIYQTTFPPRANHLGQTFWTDSASQAGRNVGVDEHPTGTRWLAMEWMKAGQGIPSYVTVLDVAPAFQDPANPGGGKFYLEPGPSKPRSRPRPTPSS